MWGLFLLSLVILKSLEIYHKNADVGLQYTFVLVWSMYSTRGSLSPSLLIHQFSPIPQKKRSRLKHMQSAIETGQ